jgi:hypothetical protein
MPVKWLPGWLAGVLLAVAALWLAYALCSCRHRPVYRIAPGQVPGAMPMRRAGGGGE